MAKFRWGIVGTGKIAHTFARGLKDTPDAQLVAVGSRSLESAEKFAVEFNVARCHGSYEALAKDSGIDAVYVSTPHQLHMENTLMLLDAGKAVLCEKPFAINAFQAKRMIDRAREKRIFLMEAMWTRLNPVSREVMQHLGSGAIGDVRMTHIHFGFRADWDPKSRLLNPELGGGGLLDVGVYCISYASMIFNKPPRDVSGMATIGETGVDEQAVFTFKYDAGELALASCAVRTKTPNEATIMGTNGMIRVPDFWQADRYFLNDIEHKPAITGNKYNYEAMEVQNCVRAGKLESDLLPLDETLQIVKVMDTLRAQWKLSYPMEQG